MTFLFAKENLKSPLAQMLRGDALARQGKYAQAIVLLDEAIRLDPTCALFYDVRGIVRVLAEKSETAAADFEKSFSLDPTFVDPLVNLGILRLAEGDLVGANLHLDHAIATDAKHPLAHCARGALHAQLRSWSASETDFDRARLAAPEIAFLRGIRVINRRRDAVLMNGQGREYRLDAACAAQQMAGH